MRAGAAAGNRNFARRFSRGRISACCKLKERGHPARMVGQAGGRFDRLKALSLPKGPRVIPGKRSSRSEGYLIYIAWVFCVFPG